MRSFRRKKSSPKGSQGPATYTLKPAAKQLGFNDEEEGRIFSLLPVLMKHIREFGLKEENLFLKKSRDTFLDPSTALEMNKAAAKMLCSYIANPDQVLRQYDIHVWANVLRLYLKEMKNPIIPTRLVELVISRNLEDVNVITVARQAVDDLPHRNMEICRDICLVLRDCVTDSERLAHAFGVILLTLPESEVPLDSSTILKQAEAVTKLMKCMILNAQEVFSLSGEEANTAPTSQLGRNVEEVANGHNDRKTGRVVTVYYQYDSNGRDELTLHPGESIAVISQISRDWYYGKKLNVEIEEVGVFPGAYCGLNGDEVFENDQVVNQQASQGLGTSVNTAQGDLLSPTESETDEGEYVEAMFEFQAMHDVEISLRVGERILLLNDSLPDDWWYGENENGEAGLFPKDYVKRLSNDMKSTVSGFTNLSIQPSTPISSPTLSKPTGNTYSKPVIVGSDLLTKAAATVNVVDTGPPAPPVRSKFRMQPSTPPAPPASSSTPATSEKVWKIDEMRYKLCYKYFVKLCQEEDGIRFVSAAAARDFLCLSKLPVPTIARILEMADIDKDSRFDRDEFIVAHHLAISISKDGMDEPSKLPSYLVPKGKRHLVP